MALRRFTVDHSPARIAAASSVRLTSARTALTCPLGGASDSLVRGTSIAGVFVNFFDFEA